MDIYHYDPHTGEFMGVARADKSPLEPGVYLIPANATDQKPPAAVNGYARCYIDGKWTQIEDHRGATLYSKADASEMEMMDLGPIPDSHTNLSPACPFPQWSEGMWVTDPQREKAAQIAQKTVDLAAGDQSMARITEDLIDVLILKGVIGLTDLPASVQQKLAARKALRADLSVLTAKPK